MDPALMKEMPVQEAFGVKCPLTLPWFYQIKGEPVRPNGPTIEWYGTIATGGITLAATVLSLSLAWVHMLHYSKPHQQKHIIRILWMVPVFTLITSITTLHYPSAMYLQVFQQMYEAIALASIFNLFCNYIRHGFNAQLAFFETGEYERLMAETGSKPGGIAKKVKVGPRFYKILVFLVFLYLPLEFLVMIFTWITQAAGVYCSTSTVPQFAHIYLFVIPLIGLILCMLGIVTFYRTVKPLIKHHKPILQIACIKIVVILDSLQGEVISILLSKGTIKENAQWTYGDITVMLPAWLLSVECLFISILFFWAFNPRRYFLANAHANLEPGSASDASQRYHGGFLGIKALLDAAWMWDLFKHCFLAFQLLPSIFRGEKKPMPVKDVSSDDTGSPRLEPYPQVDYIPHAYCTPRYSQTPAVTQTSHLNNRSRPVVATTQIPARAPFGE